jgi:hypothetical protein
MRIETKLDQARWRKPECTAVAVRAGASLLALSAFAFACIAAAAQTTGPGPDAPSSAPTSTPAPSEPQGFFDAFGNWLQQGVANAGAGFGAMVGAVGGQAGEAAKGAADAARNAAASMTKLPVSGITGGRERCMPAPNGAPDCGGAAAALCAGMQRRF